MLLPRNRKKRMLKKVVLLRCLLFKLKAVPRRNRLEQRLCRQPTQILMMILLTRLERMRLRLSRSSRMI